MPRGGRRPGAGRPVGRKHDSLFRWQVGAMCEGLRHKELEEKLAEINQAAIPDTREVWAHGKKVPRRQRKKWLRTDAGETYLEDVELALLDDHNIVPETIELDGMEYAVPASDNDTPRVRSIAVPRRLRPGERAEIIKHVAAEFGIKPITVERYWKEYIRNTSD